MIVREKSPFLGEVPGTAPQNLPETAAQASRNAVRLDGNLVPLKGPLTVATPSKVGVKKSIFLFGSVWFHWLEEVDVVRAAIAGDTMNRVVFTGDGAPKVTDASIATSGGTAYPTNAYTLGIPAPTSAPTVAVVGASVTPADAEGVSYVETFVRYLSGLAEEGPQSPDSAVLDVEFVHGQSVALSNLNAPPVGNYGITHRRIYRSVTSTAGTVYQFDQELAIGVASTTDAARTDTLGETLQSEEWSPPPDNLKGVRSHPGGFLVGFFGKTVCFSAPKALHAWPARYRKYVDYDIVGVELFGNSVLVATTGTPYLLTGDDPDYMSPARIEIAQGCVSRRGMADLGTAVAYPSPDGLMLVGAGVANNVTEAVFTREAWQALNPSSFLAAGHNGRYYAFYDNGAAQGCLVLDMRDGSVDFAEVHATAVYVDLESDTLYAQIGDDVRKWDAGAAMTLRRKGRRWDLPRPACFAWAKVRAKGYPLTFRLYADGTLKFTKTVADAKAFRLPGGYLADRVEMEVEGAVEVEEIVMTETMEEMKRV